MVGLEAVDRQHSFEHGRNLPVPGGRVAIGYYGHAVDQLDPARERRESDEAAWSF